MAGQLLQQSSGSRASGVRGSIDRRLEYAVGDLRDERRQRVDGSQRHPERSEYVHVVLLRSSDADTRPACELHTHKLWQSHADPDCDSYSNSNGNGDSNSYSQFLTYAHAQANTHAQVSPVTETSSHAAAETVAAFARAKNFAIGDR